MNDKVSRLEKNRKPNEASIDEYKNKLNEKSKKNEKLFNKCIDVIKEKQQLADSTKLQENETFYNGTLCNEKDASVNKIEESLNKCNGWN